MIKAVFSLAASLLLIAVYRHQRRRSRDGAARGEGCSSVTQYPIKEPFVGLDFLLKMHMDIPSVHRYHERYGKTFEISPLVAQPAFATIDPVNIKAITTGKEWGVQVFRLGGMEYFYGRGFLTTDGDIWHLSRKLLKPTFAKNNLQDLSYLSEQLDGMFSQLPEDGTNVDLQPLFYTMVWFWHVCKRACISLISIVSQHLYQIPARRGPDEEPERCATHFRGVHTLIPRRLIPDHVPSSSGSTLVFAPPKEVSESLQDCT